MLDDPSFKNTCIDGSKMANHGVGAANIDLGYLPLANICAARIESCAPSEYRLKRSRGWEIVLQGCFTWRQGSEGGFEWRDIPTVEE